MTPGSARVAVKQAIVGLIAAAMTTDTNADPSVAAVQVNYAAAKSPAMERVDVGHVTSAQGASFLAFRGGDRIQMQDVLSLEILVTTALPGVTPEDADTRCNELCDQILDLFSDPLLGGVLDGTLLAAKAGLLDGPDPFALTEGYGSDARITVECMTVYN